MQALIATLGIFRSFSTFLSPTSQRYSTESTRRVMLPMLLLLAFCAAPDSSLAQGSAAHTTAKSRPAAPAHRLPQSKPKEPPLPSDEARLADGSVWRFLSSGSMKRMTPAPELSIDYVSVHNVGITCLVGRPAFGNGSRPSYVPSPFYAGPEQSDVDGSTTARICVDAPARMAISGELRWRGVLSPADGVSFRAALASLNQRIAASPHVPAIVGLFQLPLAKVVLDEETGEWKIAAEKTTAEDAFLSLEWPSSESVSIILKMPLEKPVLVSSPFNVSQKCSETGLKSETNAWTPFAYSGISEGEEFTCQEVGPRGILVAEIRCVQSIGADLKLVYRPPTEDESKRIRAMLTRIDASLQRLYVKPRLILKGHSEGLKRAVFSADGQQILTVAPYERTVRVWDAATGRLLAQPGDEARNEFVADAEISPDGQRILIRAMGPSSPQVWDVASGRLLATLGEHSNYICQSAVFSPDGQRIVTTTSEKTARIWNTTDGQLLVSLQGDDPIDRAVFSPDGKRVLTASEDYRARVWDAVSGQLLTTSKETEVQNDTIYSKTFSNIAFSPDGRRVLAASFDTAKHCSVLIVWDAGNGQLLGTMEVPPWLDSAFFSPDSQRILIVGANGKVSTWSGGNGALRNLPSSDSETVTSAVFSPDGKRILTRHHDENARVWDTATGELLVTLVGQGEKLNSLEFSPDGKQVVAASSDKTALVWQIADTPAQAFSGTQAQPVAPATREPQPPLQPKAAAPANQAQPSQNPVPPAHVDIAEFRRRVEEFKKLGALPKYDASGMPKSKAPEATAQPQPAASPSQPRPAARQESLLQSGKVTLADGSVWQIKPDTMSRLFPTPPPQLSIHYEIHSAGISCLAADPAYARTRLGYVPVPFYVLDPGISDYGEGSAGICADATATSAISGYLEWQLELSAGSEASFREALTYLRNRIIASPPPPATLELFPVEHTRVAMDAESGEWKAEVSKQDPSTFILSPLWPFAEAVSIYVSMPPNIHSCDATDIPIATSIWTPFAHSVTYPAGSMSTCQQVGGGVVIADIECVQEFSFKAGVKDTLRPPTAVEAGRIRAILRHIDSALNGS